MVKKEKGTFDKRYYLPILSGRLSVNLLKLSWLWFLFSTFWLLFAYFNDEIGIMKIVFIILLTFNLASGIFSLFNVFIYRFQKLAYILMGLNFFTILINLDLTTLLMFLEGITDHDGYKQVYSLPSFIYTLVLFLLFILSSLYYIHCYQVKSDKVFAWRPNSTGGNSKSRFWFIFACAVLAPVFITGHFELALGVFLGILFTAVFPALVIDAFYAAYYIHKYPESKEKGL